MEDQPSNNHTSINNTIVCNNNNNNNNNNTSSSSSGSGSSSNSSSINASSGSRASEPVRSRWTPKPEQILILESIFNSGMVNPPKEETVRIRKLLEKFGAVGDANVFYWFQNRRSRSRRRQRQLQASLIANPPPSPALLGGGCGGVEFYDYSNQLNTCSASNNNHNTATVVTRFGTSDLCGGVDDVFSSFSCHINQHQLDNSYQLDNSLSQTPTFCSNDASNLEFQRGIITVFINGVATQMPEGPIEVKTMFGEGVILVHSSGVPVPFNDFGILIHPLQHGESYFLVPRLA